MGPNHVLSSGKDSFRDFEPESWNSKNSLHNLWKYREFRCQMSLFHHFQNFGKSVFQWYTLKERSYDRFDMWKKNLWSWYFLTQNMKKIETEFEKISIVEIVTFYFSVHSMILKDVWDVILKVLTHVRTHPEELLVPKI